MVPLDEAIAFVLAGCPPLPPVPMTVADAAGCVLAAPVAATEDVPQFANTAMDGYAVRAADLAGAGEDAPAVLPVVAEVAAGHPATRPLRPGEAMRIFTGAPVPDGADAVVMVERTSRRDGEGPGGAAVELRWAPAPGEHVRPAGGDLRAGDVVFEAGDELTPARIGVLASLGATEVVAHPRPRVGVLSTGDELVEGPEPLKPGQIRDSNRPTLLGLVTAAGFEAVDLGRARDDEEAIAAAVQRGVTTCDAVLSSGGVSMGDLDLVKVVLDRVGDMRWMQVAIRPAKPLAFGLVAGPARDGDGLRAVPVFGLPGNPVSSLVSFELFARPALRQMAGHLPGRLHRARLAAVTDVDLRRRADGKAHFVRVTAAVGVDGVVHVRPSAGQGSHQLAAAARADGLAVLADGEGVGAGDTVPVLMLGELASA
jgi:molybdenum cofactor synthesis domain-containing protein